MGKLSPEALAERRRRRAKRESDEAWLTDPRTGEHIRVKDFQQRLTKREVARCLAWSRDAYARQFLSKDDVKFLALMAAYTQPFSDEERQNVSRVWRRVDNELRERQKPIAIDPP
jgi:hypothetical protein